MYDDWPYQTINLFKNSPLISRFDFMRGEIVRDYCGQFRECELEGEGIKLGDHCW